MTIKQMAEVAGVSPATIRRAGIDLFPARFENGKRTVFNQKEAIEVMKSVRKKNFIAPLQDEMLPIQNEKVPTQSVEVGTVLTQKDMAMISSLTAGIVSQIFENLNSRMGFIEDRIEKHRECLPAPQISDRKRIAKLVSEYCSKSSCDYRSAYQELYRDFNYRYNTNMNQRAKNRGIKVIDQIENDGMLPELLSVAAEIFGPGML